MMKKRRSTHILALLLVLCLAVTLAGCGKANKQSINILSANYEEQIEIQLAYLRDLYPDADINITYMSSGKLAAKLIAEGEDTDVDIAMSLSSGYANQLKDAGMLREYQGSTVYKSEYADADNMISPNGVWCGAILVNTEELQKIGIPAPQNYQDLLDPMYEGLIVMASPVSSSTGYFFLLGLVNLYGEDEAFEYFDKLKDNIMLFGESGSVPASMVEKGEAVIGLGIDYEGMRLEADGSPIDVIFPEEGTPYDYDTALLINGKDEPSEFVLQIMETITSSEGNAVFNDYNISVIEGDPDRGEYPDSFKLLDMTGIADADRKTDLTDKWSERYE